MAELLVIRHGQASFGADNYDKLSDLGHEQSRVLGDWLRVAGWVPDRCITGTLVRQQETMSSMGFSDAPETHAGFNEYDFHDLLKARFKGNVPDPVKSDRKTHFRTLRDTILEWQTDAFDGAAETWGQFEARVADALAFATAEGAKRVLVVSSGGAIGQMVASTMAAPNPMMMELNLQTRNTGQTRFVFSPRGRMLTEFNAIPHFGPETHAEMITFS